MLNVNQVVLVVLIVCVPAQYLISKYWSQKGTTYYLQKTFSSLDDRLQLRDWSIWPEKFLLCARRFIFDYQGLAEDVYDEAMEEEDEGFDEPSSVIKLSSSSNSKNKKSIVKKNEGDYDPAVHFGTSRAPPRSPRHPDVEYLVGQVVRNKKHGYRGVIIGWDARPIVPKKLESSILTKDQPDLQEQPWYAVLIDTRDRLVPQMDYVAQKELELLSNTVIIHPVIHEYFEIGPLEASRYRLRPFFRDIYPEDD